MLRLGPAGYPEGSRDVVDAVRRIKEAGLSAMEVQFVRNVVMPEDKARAAAALAAELDITLSAHAPYYISLNSRESETVRKSREWILRTARTAKQLGAWIMVVHCASYSGGSSERVTEKVALEIGRCRQTLDMEGVDVVLGLETMGKKGQWGTLSEIHQVMEQVHGVQPVLDFAHMHARSGGAIRGKEDFRLLLDQCQAKPTKITHCHFSGIAFGSSGESHHLPISARSPDYGPLAELLRERQEGINLICESTDPVGDAQSMLGLITSASKS